MTVQLWPAHVTPNTATWPGQLIVGGCGLAVQWNPLFRTP